MRKGEVRYKHWKTDGFSGWLAERMEERGWNASQLARELGVVQSLVSRWMTGHQQPSVDSLVRIAEVLRMSVDEVLVVAGRRSPDTLEDDPRQLELIRKLREIDLTHERYLAINALLLALAQTGPSTDTRATS